MSADNKRKLDELNKIDGPEAEAKSPTRQKMDEVQGSTRL